MGHLLVIVLAVHLTIGLLLGMFVMSINKHHPELYQNEAGETVEVPTSVIILVWLLLEFLWEPLLIGIVLSGTGKRR